MIEPYKDKVRRSREAEAFRQKALLRDSIPYKPKDLVVKVPLGCTMVGITLILAAIYGVARLLMYWAR